MLLKGRAPVHRRVLAGVALTSAVAIHCLATWLLLVTAPNDYLLASLMSAVAFIIFAVVDANAAVILLRRALEGRSDPAARHRQ